MKVTATATLIFLAPAVCLAQASGAGADPNQFSPEGLSDIISKFEQMSDVSIESYIDQTLFSDIGMQPISDRFPDSKGTNNTVVFEPFNVDYGYLVKI